VTDDAAGNNTAYSQDKIDDLAYSYVLMHGYEGALAMLEQLSANSSQHETHPDDELALLCRRILEAIHDEAATIFRVLDRMIALRHNGARHHMADASPSGPNPIDRHIGNRLRQRRSELGLSLTSLASDMALTLHALALIEKGATRLDAVALERAVSLLNVSGDYFFQALVIDEAASSEPR
jgi:DNA-binding XRE family transcriptional regulator